MNNICTGLNLSVVLFVIIVGATKGISSDFYNDLAVEPHVEILFQLISRSGRYGRKTFQKAVTAEKGALPRSEYWVLSLCKGAKNANCISRTDWPITFTITGIIKGAAICFYGFIGFDCIATTGEEAKTPQRSIPLAVIGSLSIIFLAYFSMSAVLTLMVPYYEQVPVCHIRPGKTRLMIAIFQNPNAPFTAAFERLGWDFAKWIVSIGAIFGLFPSLLGSLIPLPRIIYAMAADGLLFRYLGRVNDRFHSPMVGTIISGFLTGTSSLHFLISAKIMMQLSLSTGLMALFFNLSQLVDMMSIGTLIAYTIVAACVLMLR